MRLRLAEIIKERKTTQLEVSEATGIPQGTISRWKGNKVDSYHRDTLEKLCAYFDVGVGDLLVLTDEEKQT